MDGKKSKQGASMGGKQGARMDGKTSKQGASMGGKTSKQGASMGDKTSKQGTSMGDKTSKQGTSMDGKKSKQVASMDGKTSKQGASKDGKKSKQGEAHGEHRGELHADNGAEHKQVLLTVKSPRSGYGSISNDGESDISSVTSIDELDNIPEDCLNNKILMGTVYSKDRANQDRFVPGIPVRARIHEVFRTPRSHVLNPNLYIIELQHGNFKWSIKRRHRHFLKLHTELVLLKAASQLPTTKREKIRSKLPSFPKRPEISVIGQKNLERRKRAFEKYIQRLLNMEEIRSERDVLDFVEVSMVSFVHDCGQKNKEAMISKRAGGQRAGLGFCGALKCSCCGPWNKRWMSLKDSYVLYMKIARRSIGGLANRLQRPIHGLRVCFSLDLPVGI